MTRTDPLPATQVQQTSLVTQWRADRAPRSAIWLKEILAGAVASIATLAVVLTLGLVGFAPLGGQASSLGITAAFVSVVLGGVAYALLGRSAMPVGGPSSATALIFASLAAQLVGDAHVSPTNASDLGAVISLLCATVMLMGAIQIAMGVAGLGKLAKFVPQPVLAGFMNGVAVLIVISQLPPLLGVASLDLRAGSLLERVQPFAVALGLWTVMITALAGRRWPRLPAPLIGLAAGLSLYALVRALFPNVGLGEVIGPLPQSIPSPDAAARLLTPQTAAFAWRHAGDVLTTALVLALISSLETVLGALSIDQQVNARHDAGRELVAVGVSNMVAGLFGGLPLVLLRARALATLRAGGTGRSAALAGTAFFGALYFCGPALALLPKAVLAGIMFVIAFGLVDRWTHQLVKQVGAGERSADVKQSLFVVAFVCGVTIWQGFVIGVGVGVLASLVVFIRSMNRSLMRSRFTAAARPSRRIYSDAQEQLLVEARRCIEIRELEGALFFGSADRLAVEADALDAGCCYFVLDFKRVSTIDESGAVLLQQLSMRLRRRGISLLMAGVTERNGHGLRLRAFGCFREAPRDDWFADVDYATEAAEQALLARAGTQWDGDAGVPLETCTLFRDLDPSQVSKVRRHMVRMRLARGEQLFRQNDAGDRLYVLTRGSISIVAHSGGTRVSRRFAAFSPGVMLGETAMLDGGGRTADATADTDTEIYALAQSALDTLAGSEPEIGARLYRNIAIHLSERLRRATSLQSADGS